MKVKIRPAKLSDIEGIIKVEEETWPDGLSATRDMFISRIKIFPEGTFVAKYKEKIVGVVVAEIIQYDFNNVGTSTWYNITDNGYIKKTHNKNGNAIFGVDLSVIPEMQNKGIATKLLKEIGKMAIRKNIKNALLGGRIPGYSKYHDELSPEEYIKKTTPSGEYLDPEINFYVKAGLKILKIIPNYFHDPESLDYGVLILWKNPFYIKNKLIGKVFGNIFSILFKT